MPSYRVSGSAFYDVYSPHIYEFAERVGVGISQLVQRYGIAGKSVLSLGGGTGMEEYFFWKNGCRLTIVDIDEHQGIEPTLRMLPRGDDLHFIVADANEVRLEQEHDVLFTSGFTLDERRRSDIVRQRGTDTYRRMLEQNGGTWEWPWWEDPFHPAVMRFANRLRQDGLMIVQSYYGGFDALHHRYYLWACDRQLARHGMTLVEVYRLANTTGVMLYVGVKGGPRVFPPTPAITLFHGRGEEQEVVCLRMMSAPTAEAGATGFPLSEIRDRLRGWMRSSKVGRPANPPDKTNQ